MFKQVSTKALYAKLQTFLPTITTWDVPFTAQEERARIEFMTEGEGFDTVQSVKASKRAIQWADDAPLEPVIAPHASRASLALVPALALDEPALAPLASLESSCAPLATLEASCTSLEPSACATLAELATPDPSACATPETPFQVVMRVLSQAKPKAEAKPKHSNLAGIRTVVVRNLPRDIKDTEVRALFSTHASGGLRDVYIPRNTDRSSQYFGTLKGFALVKFHTAEDSTRAYEALQSLCIRGKKVTLEFAKEDR